MTHALTCAESEEERGSWPGRCWLCGIEDMRRQQESRLWKWFIICLFHSFLLYSVTFGFSKCFRLQSCYKKDVQVQWIHVMQISASQWVTCFLTNNSAVTVHCCPVLVHHVHDLSNINCYFDLMKTNSMFDIINSSNKYWYFYKSIFLFCHSFQWLSLWQIRLNTLRCSFHY